MHIDYYMGDIISGVPELAGIPLRIPANRSCRRITGYYVKSVFPIPDGRIGVRSTVLLSLYDGANYSNFPFNIHGEYPIVYNHIIPEQYIDTDKRLWMKERKSLRVFDLTTEQYIYNVDSLFLQFGLKDRVEDLIIDSEKRYWFLTPGSSVYWDF